MKKYIYCRLIVVLFVFSSISALRAQTFRNTIHTSTIKTLTVHVTGNQRSLPILEKGSNSTISIGFDEMSHTFSRYVYRIVYCNADWTKSDLSTPEFMSGFPESDMQDGIASTGSMTPYTHYSLQLPNASVSLKLSGNYAVEFFDKYNPKKTLVTACFSIAEKLTGIQAEITASTDIDYKRNHQQLAFSISPLGFTVQQPQRDLRVVVRQNDDINSQRSNIQPSSILSGTLKYEHLPALIFEAGNEYRRFEITTHRYAGMNVRKIDYFAPFYNAELNPAAFRTNGYVFDQDQNGKFILNSLDVSDINAGAEYMLVQFSFPMDVPYIDGSLYLNGDFVQNALNENSKMTYNFDRKAYEKSLLLKQGLYNYRYLFRKTGSTDVSPAPTEGSYWQTENTYQIYVYYRPFGERYDRLVGFKELGTSF